MKVAEKEVTSSELEVVEKETSKKRDYSVDLIRIIAALSVIGTHLCLQVLNQAYNRIDWGRLLEKCFFTDGVPLFFMITGFFIMNGRSYKKIWKNTVKKVLLPTLAFVLFAQIFYMFVTNKESFLWCLQNAIYNLNIGGILHSILTGTVESINSLCAHLWYIFSYVKIIIWIPVLWLVCKEEKTPKLARRMILVFGIISCIITDIQRFVTLPNIGAIKVFNFVDREIIYVLLGYELFIHKDKIKNNRKVCIISLIGFGLVNIMRYKIEMQYMVANYFTDIVGRENFMEWKYTCLNIISGLCLFMFLYSFELKNEKLNKIILWISDKTFGIYLIHYLILAKIDLYKFEKIERFYFEIIYLVVGIIVTAILSTIIVCIIKEIKKLFIKGVKMIK